MTAVSKECRAMLAESARRADALRGDFNPITGRGSVGRRFRFALPGFPIPEQWLPCEMRQAPLVRKLSRAGSLRDFIESEFAGEIDDAGPDAVRESVVYAFARLRCRYDFPFWAALYVYIKRKGGGDDCLFRLTSPQRKFVERLERLRLARKPIRIVLLKARQWGGSTTSQLYMAWLQLMRSPGLNSLIIAHQGSGSDEIKDMFERMIKAYPARMLHPLGEAWAENEPKFVHVGLSGSIFRVPQRNCKIKIGTAERPDSCRGGDYSLVHLSEVGLWKATLGKKPEDIVRAACGGVLYKPGTMIVYESTANGVGNFFQREYDDAKAGVSQFEAMFVSWYDIEQNALAFDSEDARAAFAQSLIDGRCGREAASDRAEPGRYLWRLWELGATLEGINWYVAERAKHTSHGSMAAECPSDDVEAFVNSGSAVFDLYLVEALRPGCKKPPRLVGDMQGLADSGAASLKSLRLAPDPQGCMKVWSLPDSAQPLPGSPAYASEPQDEYVANRYLVVVDVGGRTAKADWSVIVVFDRLMMIDGGKPAVAAQWRGHTDIDLLAWKAAQIAQFYEGALLVIESNTVETHDKERHVEGGDQSQFILSQIKDAYPNLYARRRSEEDVRQGLPAKFGFHTNASTKPMVVSALVKAVREGLYVERDAACLDEMLTYERKQSGAYGAAAGKHDDLLMTRAIGLHVCFSEMRAPAVVSRSQPAPRRSAPDSMAAF